MAAPLCVAGEVEVGPAPAPGALVGFDPALVVGEPDIVVIVGGGTAVPVPTTVEGATVPDLMQVVLSPERMMTGAVEDIAPVESDIWKTMFELVGRSGVHVKPVPVTLNCLSAVPLRSPAVKMKRLKVVPVPPVQDRSKGTHVMTFGGVLIMSTPWPITAQIQVANTVIAKANFILC
jgi:hypothetical protein